MPLPESIRVKISSEAAGSIAMTPVVVREMPVREVVELMLAVTGKNAARVRELLLRGTLVSGASRFRWEGLPAESEAIEALLASFPDADPSLEFRAAACFHMVLRGPAVRIDVPIEAASRRGFLQRRSFHDELLELAVAPVYVDYSYKERADRYHVRLTAEQVKGLRAAAPLLRYPTLAAQVRGAAFDVIELFVRR
jgi:hypothetical protein